METTSNGEPVLLNEESSSGSEEQTEVPVLDETLPADRAGWEELADQSGSGSAPTDRDR